MKKIIAYFLTFLILFSTLSNFKVSFANDLESASETMNEVTITYDYLTNGGYSVSKPNDIVIIGNEIDLSVTASKSNYDFVGWNTDPNATYGLSNLSATCDTVLYAIFKKDISIKYKAYNSSVDKIEKYTLYNKETNKEIVLSSNGITNSNYNFIGFTLTDANNIINNTQTISDSLTVYGVYSFNSNLCYFDSNLREIMNDTQTHTFIGDNIPTSFTYTLKEGSWKKRAEDENLLSSTYTTNQIDDFVISAVSNTPTTPTTIKSIKIITENLNLKVGENASLVVENNTNENITFTSSDENIATINQQGVIVAKNIGQTKITVTSESGYSDSIMIMVEETIQEEEDITTKNAIISGKIKYSNDEPIENFVVTLRKVVESENVLELKTVTDKNGYFIFENLDYGVYNLAIFGSDEVINSMARVKIYISDNVEKDEIVILGNDENIIINTDIKDVIYSVDTIIQINENTNIEKEDNSTFKISKKMKIITIILIIIIILAGISSIIIEIFFDKPPKDEKDDFLE